MTIVIGIDPHKATHTAVAIGSDESELATVTVRATRQQTDKLLSWAEPFEERTWAIESAGGLGYLLAQQLVSVGEQVLDVPATLASRVRVLGSGRSNKNDPNMPAQWPSPPSDHLDCVPSLSPITPRCCGSWPRETVTSGTTAPRWCADSTR